MWWKRDHRVPRYPRMGNSQVSHVGGSLQRQAGCAVSGGCSPLSSSSRGEVEFQALTGVTWPLGRHGGQLSDMGLRHLKGRAPAINLRPQQGETTMATWVGSTPFSEGRMHRCGQVQQNQPGACAGLAKQDYLKGQGNPN